MTASACPACGAAVRAGDPWCTLCWTDLRPKPEPVPEPVPGPVPVAEPVPVAVAAAPPPSVAPVDPLTAPLAAVLGQPLAADPEAPSIATWPCVECGGRSPIDANACTTCGTPFGGRIARVDKEQRVRRRLLAIGGVVAFLALFAVLVLVTTGAPPKTSPTIEVTVAP